MTHDATRTLRDEPRERFDALVRDRMATTFAWGQHDCCLFAADCVLAQTGIDLAADLRGTYTDAMGAARALQFIGGIKAAGDRAGPAIPALAARVGDVGLVMLEDRELLAVCAGPVWLAPAATGLAARPLSGARLAWRVARG